MPAGASGSSSATETPSSRGASTKSSPRSASRASARRCVRLVDTRTPSASSAPSAESASTISSPSPRPTREGSLPHPRVAPRRPLDRVLAEYARHYNEARPHRGLQLSQPIARPVTAIGGEAITRRDVLGGIIHEYDRAA